jgi:hypothetical protein
MGLHTEEFSKFISEIFTGLIIPISLLGAIIMFIYGGILMIFSGGNASKITAGKEIIFGTIIGLILILLASVILGAIDPKLQSILSPNP